MNYFTVILLLLGTSALSASAHATTSRPSSFQYRCELESHEQFKEGQLFCKIKGSVCERPSGISTGTGLIPNICQTGNDPFELECNRGPDFRDHDAATTTRRDDVYLIASDRDHTAFLKIEDVAKGGDLESSEHQQYDAELVLTNNVTRRLNGKCQVKLLKPTDADSAVTMDR
jgi:hypothetical protein